MTAAWPSDVNQGVARDSYSEQPERNVASFAVEVGAPKERPRMSISSDLFAFTNWYTLAEWTSLVAFYRTTLCDGVLPFTRNHPATGAPGTFKWTASPAITTINGLERQVTHQMRSVP